MVRQKSRPYRSGHTINLMIIQMPNARSCEKRLQSFPMSIMPSASPHAKAGRDIDSKEPNKDLK